jgi:hypothetical protein
VRHAEGGEDRHSSTLADCSTHGEGGGGYGKKERELEGNRIKRIDKSCDDDCLVFFND